MDKVSSLRQATEEFKTSKQTANDYMKFASAVVLSTRQGSGLAWSQVLDIFEDVVGIVPSVQEVVPQPEKQPHEDEFVKFIQRRKITTPDDFRDALIPMIHEMSEYCHHLKFNERKKYRDAKHSFLKLMYINGMATDIKKEFSVSPLGNNRTDVLVHMVIGCHTFHVPNRNQDFVDIDTLPMYPTIYQRPEARPLDDINMQFNKHMVIFENMHNEQLLRNVGLNMKGF